MVIAEVLLNTVALGVTHFSGLANLLAHQGFLHLRCLETQNAVSQAARLARGPALETAVVLTDVSILSYGLNGSINSRLDRVWQHSWIL
jgi:hypothetical protein